jgi:hypothetical protein
VLIRDTRTGKRGATRAYRNPGLLRANEGKWSVRPGLASRLATRSVRLHGPPQRYCCAGPAPELEPGPHEARELVAHNTISAVVCSTDLERSREFYEQKLGLTLSAGADLNPR